ncbi:UDP-glucose 4-epimerase 4 [Cytospora mali]|uniref:UDP-glucose 4-epimerase 4 n=1 Tax=Cytospora mali TaxID=578113 RepID=A0A194USC6_CYTMA|nr:UDP-glucose 4-epimerase 4 [Valsa mali var. pyri (nom. inval.)]
MPTPPRLRTALVTGANGYIGNAVARAFVRAGWRVYGLVRSTSAVQSLAIEEILPVIGSLDDAKSHEKIKSQLPAGLDTIVSTTEDHNDYIRHYNNIISLLRTLSESSVANGIKPLVIFTSGCKDYGMGPHYANDPNLAPHTEESPIRPPAFATLRADYSQRIFENEDVFTPVLVRPTNVHGRSSSFYGVFFEVARQAAEAEKPILMTTPPDSVCHCMHVDDCGDAYVAIASHPRLEDVAGQVFNISARRYETVDELVNALVVEYGISQGVKYVDSKDLKPVDEFGKAEEDHGVE